MVFNGKKYPTVECVTVSEYCKRFDTANTRTVTNWVKRGFIPESNVVVIEDHNTLRLMKAVTYHAQLAPLRLMWE